MKIDSTMTWEQIAASMRVQAEHVYGPERARAINDQLEHLARMMRDVASRELEPTGPAPDTTGHPDRRGS